MSILDPHGRLKLNSRLANFCSREQPREIVIIPISIVHSTPLRTCAKHTRNLNRPLLLETGSRKFATGTFNAPSRSANSTTVRENSSRPLYWQEVIRQSNVGELMIAREPSEKPGGQRLVNLMINCSRSALARRLYWSLGTVSLLSLGQTSWRIPLGQCETCAPRWDQHSQRCDCPEQHSDTQGRSPRHEQHCRCSCQRWHLHYLYD